MAVNVVASNVSALPLTPMPPEPAVKMSVAALISVVASPETIAPVPPVVSVTLTPVASRLPEVPNVMFVSSLVVRLRLVAVVSVIASLIVIPPVFASPRLIVPAVMKSNSASVKPRTPPESVAPKSI